MNSESACTVEKQSFCVETIPFKSIPQQSSLFLDFQSDSPKVDQYYQKKSVVDYASEVLENYQTDRNLLGDALEKSNREFGAPEKTLENINLLREKDCVAIVTGQQAGLFSGALYTIYKILSAIRLAEDLRKQNIKAVPVFWIAEEDHDFDEVKKTFVISGSERLTEIENTPRNYQANTPVGFVKLDETIEETKKLLFSNLKDAELTSWLRSLVSKSYASNETYSTAFAKFLTEIFGKYGLIIFAPLAEELKKLSAPVFVEAVKNSDEIREALLARTKNLEENGYAAQVLVEKDFFPFFYVSENKRFALKKDETGNYLVKGTKQKFTLAELSQIARDEPQKLSANALLRPVVQDFLLPTATYFGGAAEIAYFAQNAEIYRVLNRPLTPLRHRASLTIIEPKNRRTLDKYSLKLLDLFSGQEQISVRIVNEFLAENAAQEFDQAQKTIGEQLDKLHGIFEKSEPTLTTNLETRRRKIIYHIQALMKKFQRSEIEKDETIKRRLEFLFVSLLPHKALQERTLNATYFLNLYGENFIDWIYDVVRADEKHHQILYF